MTDNRNRLNVNRRILIVDDEEINREILGNLLEDKYDLLFASNGLEALEIMNDERDTLSLVLLDIMMPKMDGKQVLAEMKESSLLDDIPVIVLTADNEAEVECLHLGAVDFIPKPYPDADIILARIGRTIELYEKSQILNLTERDSLTGLYNKDFFYRYVTEHDMFNPNTKMDAIVLDVYHFHIINDRFGMSYGDAVLRNLSAVLSDIFLNMNGIVGRKEGDEFLIYVPTGNDYNKLLEEIYHDLFVKMPELHIRLRMGIYTGVDSSINVERRFDRAKMATNKIKNSVTKSIEYYDEDYHKKELYASTLVEDFENAIEHNEFFVCFQPKYNIQCSVPVLVSAEALVRWQHKTLGMISPGVFIPLFEENGLIHELDKYVWAETAKQIASWKKKYGFAIPVSVNVSRIDLYDPNLKEDLLNIVLKNKLQPTELLLEITESAYTQDSKLMIEVIEELRSVGFRIEMDDFGSGYSSLNMLSALPLDALKLDMQFVRTAFTGKKDMRLIEAIVDIAAFLAVPVIAEGVETEEQMDALAQIGCDIVQGYYFSKPVPASQFEQFLLERIQLDNSSPEVIKELNALNSHHGGNVLSFSAISQSLTQDYICIYYVDMDNDSFVEFSSKMAYKSLRLRTSGDDFFELSRHNAKSVIYAEDREYFLERFKKDKIVEELEKNESFTMRYRLLMNDVPTYVSMHINKMIDKHDHHIVIGISNINSEIEAKRQLTAATKDNGLRADYFSMYFVNIKDDSFEEFSSNVYYKSLGIEQNGKDFFGVSRVNVLKVLYPDDIDMFLEAFSKQNILDTINKDKVFTIRYRLWFEGKPEYVEMKAYKSEKPDHIVISVENINDEILKEKNAVTFTTIAKSLANDYMTIHYVNIEDDTFVEYSSDDYFKSLGIEQNGQDFFNLSRQNILKVICPDDIDHFMASFTKENILSSIEKNKSFNLTYRLMINGEPEYMHMKATRMDDENGRHIVIGVSNINDQVKLEKEHTQIVRIANQDALTGVKSKHAYNEEEKVLNRGIIEGFDLEFAIAIFDLNNLKKVNDNLGHVAGDQYIKDSCKIICDVFKHSPVYRVGGDEFIAILTGADYANRRVLFAELQEVNKKSFGKFDGAIACGISEFDKEHDKTVQDVLDRADNFMYENKWIIKVNH